MSNFEYDLNEIQETLFSQLLSRRALIPFPFHVEAKSQRDVNCQLHVCDDDDDDDDDDDYNVMMVTMTMMVIYIL